MNAAKAIAYLRVSGRGQVEGDGFDRQSEAIVQFARSTGLQVVAEFRDEGVSGTKDLDSRPGLAAALEEAQKQAIGVLVIERADRLARDLMVNEVIVGQFAKHGIRVLTADGADLTSNSDDPTRTLIRQVLGAVAQFEKSVTVMKLRAARERTKLRTGRCEGRKPFGSTLQERAVIDRMKALRRKPRRGRRPSFKSVATALNAEGLPTRTGRPWAAGTVAGILGRVA